MTISSQPEASTPSGSIAPGLLQFSNQLAAVIAAATPSIVAVHGRGYRTSSGILWQPGLVVSAEETIERDASLGLSLPDGQRIEATLSGRDPSTDIAVLNFAAPGSTAAPFTRHVPIAELRVGQLALVVGRANDTLVAAQGIVSIAGPAWRSSQGGLIDARLRIDARLPAMAEGGAVLAADGSLIGMAVFGPRRSLLTIPAATIARIVQAIKDKGHVARGYLGVGLQRVSVASDEGGDKRRGVMVVTVDPAGPAKAAGILQGDIILTLGGTAVTGVRSLYRELGPDTVGQKKAVELIRAGARSTVDVTIAARPRRDDGA